jgi:TRAP-type mannitol/chloroaromatic compound transport system permease small subunit
MHNLSSFLHMIDHTNDWIGSHLSYLMVPFVLLTVFEVFMRYCLNTPTQWAEELVLLVFGPYSVLGGAYTFVHNLHIRVDVVWSHFSERKKAIADLITSLLFFFFVVLVLWKGGKMALESVRNLEHTQSVWSPVIYPTKLTIPVAAFLVLLQGLAKFIRDLYFVVEGTVME